MAMVSVCYVWGMVSWAHSVLAIRVYVTSLFQLKNIFYKKKFCTYSELKQWNECNIFVNFCDALWACMIKILCFQLIFWETKHQIETFCLRIKPQIQYLITFSPKLELISTLFTWLQQKWIIFVNNTGFEIWSTVLLIQMKPSLHSAVHVVG